MVKDKKFTLYNFGLYVILFVIISAIVVALLRLFQVGVSVSYIVKISLPKIITGIKLLIAPIIAFLGAMITDPEGCANYYKRIEEYNNDLLTTVTSKEEDVKLRNTELLDYITTKEGIFAVISLSLTALSSIIVLANIVNSDGINITYDSILVPIVISIMLTMVLFMFKRLISCKFYTKLKI